MPTGRVDADSRSDPGARSERRRQRPIRVVAVAGEPGVRGVVRHELMAVADISLVAASDPVGARGAIYTHRPDVVLLDLEPAEAALALLRELAGLNPIPTVLFTRCDGHAAGSILAALDGGAIEVVARPQRTADYDEVGDLLREAIRAADVTHGRAPDPPRGRSRSPSSGVLSRGAAERSVIVIGAATGALPALRCLLAALPPLCPPIAVAFHHPTGLSAAIAEDLDAIGPIRVAVAEDGRPLRPCEMLIAPGGRHLELVGTPGSLRTTLRPGALHHGHRPAADPLLRSAATAAGGAATGIILSGRGRDGAAGLRALHAAGGETIAQDEATAPVYGMPAEAIKRNAVDHVLPEQELARGAMRCAMRYAKAPGR